MRTAEASTENTLAAFAELPSPAASANAAAADKNGESDEPGKAPATADESTGKKNPAFPSGEEVYWDQMADQKAMIEYFMNLTGQKFAAPPEPTAVFRNPQDFDQYVYDNADETQLTQWKKGNEVLVEQLEMANGDKVIRRFPNSVDDDGVAETSYESKDGSEASGVTYYRSGQLRSSWIKSNNKITFYYYDEQGRLIDVAYGN